MNQHIMNQEEFDLWAGSYDESVGRSDQQNTYPFAGYRQVLNEIYRGVLSQPAKTVLDIGFGTGCSPPSCTSRAARYSARISPRRCSNWPGRKCLRPSCIKGISPMAWQSP